MMVSGHYPDDDDQEEYDEDSEPLTESDGQYSDEEYIIEQEEIIVPHSALKTFEEYNQMYKPKEELAEVDKETEAMVEQQLMKLPEKTATVETPKQDEPPLDDEYLDDEELEEEEFDEEIEEEEEDLEHEDASDVEELSGKFPHRQSH